jgi:hypothetical protein
MVGARRSARRANRRKRGVGRRRAKSDRDMFEAVARKRRRDPSREAGTCAGH